MSEDPSASAATPSQDGPLDVLFINPGGREIVYQQLGAELTAIEPPLWCRLLAGYARDRGFRVAILDSEAEALAPERVADRVRALQPVLAVMVVFGHQPSASTQAMVGASAACAAIKAASPDTPILICGGHPSALPERTLREEPVDYACVGEGPETVAQLAAALRRSAAPDADDLARVPGLVWRRDGAPAINASAPLIADLDADLHGDVWDLLPMDRYRAHNWQCFGALETRQPYASIYTSLGCPFRCSFCCINAPFGANRYRMRAPAAVVAEIDLLHRRYGVGTFKIVDEMFVLNDRHVDAICDGLLRLGYADALNIWAYARVDTVKPEMLAKLRAAGIRWLALGIESGSAHVRDGAGKAMGSADIVAVVRAIQAADIHVIGNFIFGLPDDTRASMEATLELARDLNCEFANFYAAMAYPGSALFQAAIDRGWPLPERWSGYAQHAFDCLPLPTESLSARDVLRFRDDAFHAYFADPAYLDMVARKFGSATRDHVTAMSARRLKRALVPDAAGPPV